MGSEPTIILTQVSGVRPYESNARPHDFEQESFDESPSVHSHETGSPDLSSMFMYDSVRKSNGSSPGLAPLSLDSNLTPSVPLQPQMHQQLSKRL
jgi:hypothetical protein